MNVSFVNPFLNATLNVLSTMANLQAEPGEISLKHDEIALGDITGIIEMSGEKVNGTLAISFSEGVVFEVTKRMLGDIVTEINDTVTDLVGEFTNMITGGAKKPLSERGYKFDMAIPSVLSGKDHYVHHPVKGPTIVVPFSTGAGDLYIELCFK